MRARTKSRKIATQKQQLQQQGRDWQEQKQEGQRWNKQRLKKTQKQKG